MMPSDGQSQLESRTGVLSAWKAMAAQRSHRRPSGNASMAVTDQTLRTTRPEYVDRGSERTKIAGVRTRKTRQPEPAF